MSVQAITWAYAQQGLTGTQKFVLVTLANYANGDWECWPSVEDLVGSTGIAERSVRDALKHLEAGRYLTRERERFKDGSLGRYQYLLDHLRMPEGGLQAVKTPVKKHEGNLGAAYRAGPETKQQKSQQNHGPASPAGGSEFPNEILDRRETPVRQPPAADAARTTGGRRRSTKPSLTSNRHIEDSSDTLRSSDVSKAFLEIWNLWPGQARVRSKSKAQCLETLKRACGQRQPAMMVEAVRRFVKTIDNPKYVPALDRWLKDGRFEHFLPADNVHQLPLREGVDWQAVLNRWREDRHWPRTAGDPPDHPGYAGPVDLLEKIIAEFTPGHPTAVVVRRLLDQRRRA